MGTGAFKTREPMFWRGCPCRKSNPNVLVMQTTKMRLCEDPTDVLNFAWNRRVFVQRQMCAGWL